MSDNADNMKDLRKLRDRVQEIAKEMNLDVISFSIIPGKDEHDNDILTISALIGVEALETIEETQQRKTDDAFEAIFAKEFGGSTDFLSDETKAALKKEEEEKEAAAKALREVLDDFDI
jgi:hypothetical protein